MTRLVAMNQVKLPPGTTNIFLSPSPTESSKVKIKSEDIINNDDTGSYTETDTVKETVEKETPPDSPKQEVGILIPIPHGSL